MGELESEFSGTGRFDVVRTLGSGGMGVVFEVIDRVRDVRVALKTLRHLDPRALYRFKREFRALHDLHHPNLVRIDELVEDRGQWFFTMELIRGVDFFAYVKEGAPGEVLADTMAYSPRARRGSPPPVLASWPNGTDSYIPVVPAGSPRRPRRPRTTVDIGRLRTTLGQLANGLSALHEAGKVHRDIKPSNVLVTGEGKVVLVDFGVVADSRAGIGDTADVFVGTVGYMAPEQAAGQNAGPAADWYSVGVMLYEALTDKLPFDGTTLQVAMDKQRDEPAPPSTVVRGVPRDLDQLCQALLRRVPAERAGRLAVLRCAGIAPPPVASVRREPTYAWPMVGRDAELAALREAYTEVGRGGPVTVLVTGESGIGKSALIREVALGLAAEADGDVAVLSGRCYEREAVPYKALDGVVDALAHFLRGLPDVSAAAMLPPSAALLRRVFPVLGGVDAIARAPAPRREIQDPLELRRRAFASLRQLLQMVTEHYRTIVTIDDLQWADADSLLLLQDLLCPPEPPALLLLTSVRTDAAGTLPAPATQLPGEVRRLDLRVLDRDAAEQLAAMLLAHYRVQHVEAAHVAAEAAGHPLYLGELVRHLATEGGPEGPPHTGDLPRLDDAIHGRVQHLPSVAHQVLELVCLGGGPLPRDAVRRAADLDERVFAEQIALLRAGHFIRGATATCEGLEPYHDRVREAVVRRIAPERRSAALRSLASALGSAASATEQPELLLYHLRLVGETERATELAISAAERAASALAFDRAADLYTAALELGDLAPPRRRELTHRLAQTLVHAGRGPEAAARFQDAAVGTDPVTRLDCLRLAAEQLLRSGHLGDGIELLRALLAETGLPFPSTPRRALASLLWQRARLRLRGRRWTLRSPREISDRDLLHADLCTSVGQSLGWVDNIRGAVFQTRGLRLALDLGEPIRLARALGTEAAYQTSQGGRGIVRGAALCADLYALTERSTEPYMPVFAAHIEGVCAYFTGRFSHAVRRLVEAETMSRDDLVGTMYETATARLARLRALRLMGAFDDMGTMLEIVVRDAARRGDRYSETSLRRSCSLLFLARDDLDGARDNLARATWTPLAAAFHVQHWFELEARAEIALYEGADDAHRDQLAASLAAAESSLLTRVQTVRAITAWLRGRLLLAGPDGNDARRQVRELARRLRGEGIGYAVVFAHLLEAGLATRDQASSDAAARWRAAADAADAAEMAVLAACARLRAAQLTPGEPGAAARRQAEAALLAAGVRRPDRFVEVCAPAGSRQVGR